MPREKKKLHIHHDHGSHGHNEELEAETVEQGLRDLAKKVKRGDVDLPYVVEFEGPAGSKFKVTVETVEAAQEMTTFGFMF